MGKTKVSSTKKRSKKAAGSQSAGGESAADDRELQYIGPSQGDETTQPPPEPQQADTQAAAADDADPSATLSAAENPWFKQIGAAVVLLVAIVCVWCLALIPVHIVADRDSLPTEIDNVFAVSNCIVQISRAQVVGSEAQRALALQCIANVRSRAPGTDTNAAVEAANVGDLALAAVDLQSTLRRLFYSQYSGTGQKDVLQASWAPIAAALALEATRGYEIAAATTGSAPTTRTFADVSTLIGASVAPLSKFAFGPVPDSIQTAASQLVAQSVIDTATIMSSPFAQYTGDQVYASMDALKIESTRGLDALQQVIQQAMDASDAAYHVFLADTIVTSILLGLAACACVAGGVGVAMLTRRYASAEDYRRVIRADFEVIADSSHAVPRMSVLRALSLACAKFSVLSCEPDPGVDSNFSQMVLHLRRTQSTLEALRPFVPAFAFSKTRTFDAFGRVMRRLSMGPGIEREPVCTLVAVGLRDFNRDVTDIAALPEFIAAVTSAAHARDGTVAQITPTHIIVIFSRMLDDAGEESMNASERNQSGIEAVRMAFAVLGAGVALQSRFPTLSISIGISQGCALVGPLTTHSTKVFAAASHIVTTALFIESFTRDLGVCIVLDAETARSVEDCVLTRPVSLCSRRSTTMHEAVLDLAVGTLPVGVKDKCRRWAQTFEKYEEAVNSLAPDKLEDAFNDLQTYRQFAIAATGSSEHVEDSVFTRVADHLRRLMVDMGVKV